MTVCMFLRLRFDGTLFFLEDMSRRGKILTNLRAMPLIEKRMVRL